MTPQRFYFYKPSVVSAATGVPQPTFRGWHMRDRFKTELEVLKHEEESVSRLAPRIRETDPEFDSDLLRPGVKEALQSLIESPQRLYTKNDMMRISVMSELMNDWQIGIEAAWEYASQLEHYEYALGSAEVMESLAKDAVHRHPFFTDQIDVLRDSFHLPGGGWHVGSGNLRDLPSEAFIRSVVETVIGDEKDKRMVGRKKVRLHLNATLFAEELRDKLDGDIGGPSWVLEINGDAKLERC